MPFSSSNKDFYGKPYLLNRKCQQGCFQRWVSCFPNEESRDGGWPKERTLVPAMVVNSSPSFCCEHQEYLQTKRNDAISKVQGVHILFISKATNIQTTVWIQFKQSCISRHTENFAFRLIIPWLHPSIPFTGITRASQSETDWVLLKPAASPMGQAPPRPSISTRQRPRAISYRAWATNYWPNGTFNSINWQ